MYTILVTICVLLILIICINIFTPAPKVDKFKTHPPKYFIDKPNVIEMQGHNQCAGYSTAYLLRYFGYGISGTRVYSRLKYRIPVSGYVSTRGILAFLNQYGLRASLYTGTLDSLKARVSTEGPVIVYIADFPKWGHYITLVGYDDMESRLYFVDSLRPVEEGAAWNSVFSEDEFTKYWKTRTPNMNCIYICADYK